jgi:cyclopropane fatty-acyl-phospholipid synthase-like methyltransferase
LEPSVVLDKGLSTQLRLLNVDVLTNPAPRVLDQLFDLVFSIEVAEHVSGDRHEALFDFLISRAGRMIVFSGARSGQVGHIHITERPELEWREEFTGHKIDYTCHEWRV